MTTSQFRTERDSLGEVEIPADALYGAQTQRAVDNFPISGLPMPAAFIRALALVKSACAAVNQELGLLDAAVSAAIQACADDIARGRYSDQFPIDVYQTGSGTSTNMNANEVIARLAGVALGQTVHPNDHVNMSQSSNDVVPTTIHVSACIEIEEHLLPALARLADCIDKRAHELRHVTKTGRTHLMDAMPVTFGQELSAWSEQVRHARYRIQSALTRLRAIPLGGTAVGTGINAPAAFGEKVAHVLHQRTGISFKQAENLFYGIASQDAAVEMSGHLKSLSVALMKIANDLRWMNSGPLAGLGEISLPALQPGSSIMPGKVNPVIPEAVAQVCAQVMGNDLTISIAGQSGNFQLNVMLPVIAYNLLQSIHLLETAATTLADKAIAGFSVNEEQVAGALSGNPILVTALNRVIGYEKGAAIAKQAYAQKRPVLEVALEQTDIDEAELRKLLDPVTLTGADK